MLQPSDLHSIPQGLFEIYKSPGLLLVRGLDDLDPGYHEYRNLQSEHRRFACSDSFYRLKIPCKSIVPLLPTVQ